MNKQQRQRAIDLAATAIALICNADHATKTPTFQGGQLREKVTVERMQELAKLAEPAEAVAP